MQISIFLGVGRGQPILDCVLLGAHLIFGSHILVLAGGWESKNGCFFHAIALKSETTCPVMHGFANDSKTKIISKMFLVWKSCLTLFQHTFGTHP